MRAFLPFVMLLAVAAAPASTLTVGGEAFAPTDILDARAMPDIEGKASVMLTFSPAAAARLGKVTADHVGRTMSVRLGGEELTRPMVQDVIEGNVVEIGVGLPLAEAQALAKRISGKDPLPDSLDE